MASWRDSASAQSQEDLDRLLNEALRLAREQLDRRGDFGAFAMARGLGGEARLLAASGEVQQHASKEERASEEPTSAQLLASLRAAARAERDELRAVAIASDVSLRDTDAVRVDLEHVEGHAMTLLLPYRRKALRKVYEYGTLAMVPYAAAVWAD